jgi:hypothetical protein
MDSVISSSFITIRRYLYRATPFPVKYLSLSSGWQGFHDLPFSWPRHKCSFPDLPLIGISLGLAPFKKNGVAILKKTGMYRKHIGDYVAWERKLSQSVKQSWPLSSRPETNQEAPVNGAGSPEDRRIYFFFPLK